MKGKQTPRLSHAELLQLKRWNTPSVYNGWEAITKQRHAQPDTRRTEQARPDACNRRVGMNRG
jgi:hypothetical protein